MTSMFSSLQVKYNVILVAQAPVTRLVGSLEDYAVLPAIVPNNNKTVFSKLVHFRNSK